MIANASVADRRPVFRFIDELAHPETFFNQERRGGAETVLRRRNGVSSTKLTFKCETVGDNEPRGLHRCLILVL